MKLPKNEPPRMNIDEVEKDFETCDKAVINEFAKRAKQETQRFDDATSSTFHVTVCFQTQSQLLEFMKKSGWDAITDEIFIDGMEVAQKMGIKLESPVPPIRKRNKFGGEYLNNILE